MNRVFGKNRIYVLLMTGIISVTALTVSVGETGAYYMNASSYQAVCEQTPQFPSSNYLVSGGQIVQLQEVYLEADTVAPLQVEITLESKTMDMEGYLSYNVVGDKIAATFLKESGEKIAATEKYLVEAGKTEKIQLQIKIEDKAEELTEAVLKKITVQWSQSPDNKDNQSISAEFWLWISPKGATVTDKVTATGEELQTDIPTEIPKTTEIPETTETPSPSEVPESTEEVDLNGTEEPLQSEAQQLEIQKIEILQISTDKELPIVSKQSQLVWTIAGTVSNVEYYIEYLTKDGYQKISPEHNVSVSDALENGQGTITIDSNVGKAIPGTYRITVVQKDQETEIQRKTENFFINYR